MQLPIVPSDPVHIGAEQNRKTVGVACLERDCSRLAIHRIRGRRDQSQLPSPAHLWHRLVVRRIARAADPDSNKSAASDRTGSLLDDPACDVNLSVAQPCHCRRLLATRPGRVQPESAAGPWTYGNARCVCLDRYWVDRRCRWRTLPRTRAATRPRPTSSIAYLSTDNKRRLRARASSGSVWTP